MECFLLHCLWKSSSGADRGSGLTRPLVCYTTPAWLVPPHTCVVTFPPSVHGSSEGIDLFGQISNLLHGRIAWGWVMASLKSANLPFWEGRAGLPLCSGWRLRRRGCAGANLRYLASPCHSSQGNGSHHSIRSCVKDCKKHLTFLNLEGSRKESRVIFLPDGLVHAMVVEAVLVGMHEVRLRKTVVARQIAVKGPEEAHYGTPHTDETEGSASQCPLGMLLYFRRAADIRQQFLVLLGTLTRQGVQVRQERVRAFGTEECRWILSVHSLGEMYNVSVSDVASFSPRCEHQIELIYENTVFKLENFLALLLRHFRQPEMSKLNVVVTLVAPVRRVCDQCIGKRQPLRNWSRVEIYEHVVEIYSANTSFRWWTRNWFTGVGTVLWGVSLCTAFRGDWRNCTTSDWRQWLCFGQLMCGR